MDSLNGDHPPSSEENDLLAQSIKKYKRKRSSDLVLLLSPIFVGSNDDLEEDLGNMKDVAILHSPPNPVTSTSK
ncbi:hypothetical protein ACH5RR_002714 [Cinchona calisaya]|uniref:Uncharacterized protein n=1 Tax=Cinchona calisaya TaxID=153742 RepID=A0ABD3ASW1_9GENT